MVAAEAQLEEVAGAAGLGTEHAGRAPDGRQVEVFGLAGSHPDLVPQCVVNHAVALLAAVQKGKELQSEELTYIPELHTCLPQQAQLLEQQL